MFKAIYKLAAAGLLFALASRMAFIVGTKISSGQVLSTVDFALWLFSGMTLHLAYMYVRNLIRRREPDTQLNAMLRVLNVGGGPKRPEPAPGANRYFVLVAAQRLALALILCALAVLTIYLLAVPGRSSPHTGVHYVVAMAGVVAVTLLLDKLISLKVSQYLPFFREGGTQSLAVDRAENRE